VHTVPFRLILAFGLLLVAGSAQADSFFYTFDFAPTSLTGEEMFSYTDSSPTAPGTGITDIMQTPPPLFLVEGLRASDGSWQFVDPGFNGTSLSFVALTDASFPNSPGIYTSILSQVTFTSFFGPPTTADGTVTISIAQTPEPASALLVAACLLPFAVLLRKGIRRNRRCSDPI
jgi:hypothetical protein